MEKGNLSINSDNILPIIKKWLYSDIEIFVRELVSNASDAINKLDRLDRLGEIDLPDEDFRITVTLDAAKRSITFSDNGVGMDAEEIKKYINQIAFSGATDFINQYKDKMEAGGDIIGHFGLGFYSAFMVTHKVEINTLSYREGAQPALWSCDGGIEYEITGGTRTERGTDVILHIGEDGNEFLNDYKLRQSLKKYCSFIPVDIYYENVATEVKEGDDEPTPINDKKPLWTKKPSDCSDDDYKKFYRDLFMDFNEPLFWIHLNMDHPFRLKGILYFPRLKHELEYVEGQVKLFSNQVFVADNIKEVVPEFLLLLKGVMDCPDLPLNVSRSFLQNDGYVTKMSTYIVRKVADKLVSLATADKEAYSKFWDDISQFVKYGVVRQDDFYNKVKDAVLYKSAAGEYFSIGEYLERNEEKVGKKVIYTDDINLHGQYVKLFEAEGVDCILLTSRLDVPFMSHVERFEEGLTFVRIDADPSSVLLADDNKETFDDLIALFKENLEDEIAIEVQAFKNPTTPAMIFISEDQHRMNEMSKLYGFSLPGLEMGDDKKLVLNANNELVKSLNEGGKDAEDTKILCEHIWDMASLSHKHLEPERMEKFIQRNVLILQKLADK